jgi:hypothetical protein
VDTLNPIHKSTANTFTSLDPGSKTLQMPVPSKRRKRFAKIREKIEGKR